MFRRLRHGRWTPPKKNSDNQVRKKRRRGEKKVKYRRPCILLLLQPSENGSRIPTMSSRKRRNPRSPSLRPEAAVRANIWKGQFLVSDSNESALFLFLWLPLLWPFFFCRKVSITCANQIGRHLPSPGGRFSPRTSIAVMRSHTTDVRPLPTSFLRSSCYGTPLISKPPLGAPRTGNSVGRVQ